jgi:Ran GTPase-activating protein (RanGAP) involved in mRNA processing and transport
MKSLAKAQLPRLSVLRLAGCGLRNDDLRSLANAAFFERLRAIDLQTNEIGDRGIKCLATSPVAKSLRLLSAGDNSFGKAALLTIAKLDAFPALTTLDLHSSVKRKATDADVTKFLQTLEIPGLRNLDLNGWPVTDEGAKALAANRSLANLRWLSLGYCQIGRAGLRALAKSPHLRNLVYLNLTLNPCSEAADLLLDPALFPNLAECWITRVNDPAGPRLKEARPNVRWV